MSRIVLAVPAHQCRRPSPTPSALKLKLCRPELAPPPGPVIAPGIAKAWARPTAVSVAPYIHSRAIPVRRAPERACDHQVIVATSVHLGFAAAVRGSHVGQCLPCHHCAPTGESRRMYFHKVGPFGFAQFCFTRPPRLPGTGLFGLYQTSSGARPVGRAAKSQR